ncbi:flagellin [Parvularcula maris]|uniref:Flagellin n=1 Tax=Parvularcula maris TaxID=2965077 RepID=A0A9X2RKN1_9PROT|nr:flagellin [Parvularcula maris]MCQ8185958.1 flagellin [Parvularcula maris]
MVSLITNAAAQTALQQLRAVDRAGETVRAEISTGLKVRQAGDNPAFFLVSQQVRGDIAVQSGLAENLTMLEGAIKAAEAGLREINRLTLQFADLIPVAQTGIAVAEMEVLFEDLLDQVRDTVEAAEFQGTNLLTQVGSTSSIIGLNRTDGGFKAQTLTMQGGDFLRDSFFDGLVELDGEFVVRANNYSSIHSAVGRADGLVNEWEELPDGRLIWRDDGVGGGGGADSPSNRTDLYRRAVDAENFAPRIDFRLRVTTPGTYYVNVRGEGQGGAADSIHVGFDGNVLTGTGGVKLPTNSEGWGTNDTLSGARVAINIPTAGIYTLNIWGREDGSIIEGVQFIKDDASIPSSATALPPPTPISGSDIPYYTDPAKGEERRGRAGVVELLSLLNPTALQLVPEGAFEILDAVRARVNNYQSVIGSYAGTISRQRSYLGNVTDLMEQGVAALIEADLAEASSRLQAVQVQEQLATQSLTQANQRPSVLLSLFR